MSLTGPNNEILKLPANHVICREGDMDTSLYFVAKGKLLICLRSGHMVTPVGYLEGNEYFGEMSFFDNSPRSADVITVEDTNLIKIPSSALKDQVPTWLLVIAKRLTHKLRTMDHVIREKGIKRTNVKSLKPLSNEEQKRIYKLLSEY